MEAVDNFFNSLSDTILQEVKMLSKGKENPFGILKSENHAWPDLKNDIMLIGIMTIVLFFLHSFLDIVFKRIGTVILAKQYTAAGSVDLARLQKKKKKGGDDDDDDNEPLENMVIKFSDSCWKVFYYLSSYIFGIYASISEPFLFNTELIYQEYPNTMTIEIKWYYIISFAFYFYSIFSLLMEKFRKKDFLAMFCHHVVTVFLISYSYFLGFTNIGIITLLCHDINDIILEGSKLFKYRKMETIATIGFAIFVLSWIVTRFTLFPLLALYPTVFHYPKYIAVSIHYYCTAPFLFVLLALHIYWGYLIFLIAKTAILGKGLSDITDKKEKKN